LAASSYSIRQYSNTSYNGLLAVVLGVEEELCRDKVLKELVALLMGFGDLSRTRFCRRFDGKLSEMPGKAPGCEDVRTARTEGQ